MTAPVPVSEDRLHAYVDGALDAAAVAEIEAWLADNPEAAAEVAAWRAQREALRAAYDPVLAEPVPEGISALLADRGRQPGRAAPWLRAAAGLALFAVGTATGWLAHERIADGSEKRFVSHAVGAHVVFTNERRHAVEVLAEKEEAHLVRWLSARLGRQFRPPALAEAGFVLYGGRLVADDGGPAAQYMYQDSEERRLTLYVRQRRDVPETAFRFASERGAAAFYWIDGPLAYALVGPLPREQMLQLARLVHEQLRATDGMGAPRS
jgi:anti-sigma factor RsiW